MSSEAKMLFAEHLTKTNPQGVSLVSRVKMTSSLAAPAFSHVVSRLELIDDPHDDVLPDIRRQQLAWVEDFEESRFLLDQTVHLGVDDSPAGVAASSVRLFVWDPNASKSHEFPLNDFYAFPHSALRLADYLLPFPEIATWSIPVGSPTPQSIASPTRPAKVITISIPEPPPDAGPLKRWLWPDLRTVQLWIDATDLRLLLVEMSLTNGRFRTNSVAAWADVAGANVPTDFTVTDINGAWSRIEAVQGKVKGYGADYYTRLRLDTKSFGS
jgi:hypothetical protein